jgi:hypothetical protein
VVEICYIVGILLGHCLTLADIVRTLVDIVRTSTDIVRRFVDIGSTDSCDSEMYINPSYSP